MRSPRLRALIVVAAASVAVSGCSWIGGDQSTTSTTTPSATPTTAPPALEMLDPGAEPRRVLELRFVEGDSATVAFASDLKVTDLDGATAIDPPPVVQIVRFDIDGVTADEADVSFEVTGVSIDNDAGTLDDTAILELTV
ncbi:MAG: hypothetical protein ABI239_07645, partial [Aquihabitans sp.]